MKLEEDEEIKGIEEEEKYAKFKYNKNSRGHPKKETRPRSQSEKNQSSGNQRKRTSAKKVIYKSEILQFL